MALMRDFLNIRLFLVAICFILANRMSGQSQLLINEIQVANLDQYIDHSYNYGAWIELYNPTEQDVTLSGMQLKHTDAEGTESSFRLTIAHGLVPAKGFAILWFDHYHGTGYYGNYSAKQVNLQLDPEGGEITLMTADDQVVDALPYPSSIARASYLRSTDGGKEWGFTAQPSPGMSNNGCVLATNRVAAPVVSTTGGVIQHGLDFHVDIPDSTTLLFSTDGSVPMPGKGLVSEDGQFHVDTTVIYRFMLAREGWLNSPVVTRTFIYDNLGLYLPVLNVSSHPDNFFDDTIGLYVRGTNGRTANNSKTPANQNMDWERPVNVEYFVPDAQGKYQEAINQEVRFTIFGGWTRFNAGNEFFDHRSSFKLKCEKVFEGIKSYDYPVFNTKPYIKLKSMLVRNGGQDQYMRIKDAAIHELVRTSGLYLDCQAWQPAHVFINGHYLGMLNLREESNRQFAFSNYGIDNEDIDQWEDELIIKAGDAQQLNQWYNAAMSLGRNPILENWQKVAEVLDVDEYCNYMAAEIYAGNLDWLRGGFKNLKGFCCRSDDGRIHLVFHDLDGGFGDTDMLHQVLTKGNRKLPEIFKSMMKYGPFQKQFIDAYCMMGGSVFEPERAKPIIYKMAETTAQALSLEKADPMEKVKNLYNALADTARKAALLETLRTTLKLEGEYGMNIHSNVEGARILLNGQEIPTGRFNWMLFPPIQLTPVAPAGYVFKGWDNGESLLTADSVIIADKLLPQGDYELVAVYEPLQKDPARPKVRINEVSAGNDIYVSDYGKKSDWLELYNTTDEDFDLASLYLSDDPAQPLKARIEADPQLASTIIPAHGYRIVWCDDRTSQTQLHVPFKLENADGAFVSITAADGTWSDSIRYLAQPRWQTFGRYSDGGTELALFGRPTIELPNSVCTNNDIFSETIPVDIQRIDTNDIADGSEILSTEYYDLNGIRINTPQPNQIFIEKVLYLNGTVSVRKVLKR